MPAAYFILQTNYVTCFKEARSETSLFAQDLFSNHLFCFSSHLYCTPSFAAVGLIVTGTDIYHWGVWTWQLGMEKLFISGSSVLVLCRSPVSHPLHPAVPEPWAAAEPFSEPPKAIPGVLVVVRGMHRAHPSACDCSRSSKSRVLQLGSSVPHH